MHKLSNLRFLIVCLLAIFFFRAITLEALSLMDPTESRYAFIAAEMVSSGDWITPKLPYPEGVIPYLGKPPLHFWLTAISMSLFGGDEWCVRLPSFLGLIVICASLYSLFKRESVEQGIIAAMFAASSALLFFFAGSSVVDITLTALVTLGIVSYVLCAQYKDALNPWQSLFFASLGLGFLTKGPVAIVLILFPLLLWHLLDKNRKIPALAWKRGILLTLCIPLPWFILSEMRNPGFVNYFFVHENFLRYVSPNYGDRYGSGHKHSYGAVWWMFAAGLLPWTPLLFIQIRKSRAEFAKRNFIVDLGAVWIVSVCFFFTFIRQLHSGYVIPALPGAAILMTTLVMTKEMQAPLKIYLRCLCFLLSVLTGVMLFSNNYLNYTKESYFRCIAVGILTFGILFYFEKLRLSSKILTIKEFGIGIVALTSAYATANLALSSYIGDRSSAEGILAYVTANDHLALSEVTTITRNTFSHYYYGKEWKDELSHAVHMSYVDPMDLSKNIPKNVIVSQKELSQIPQEIQNKYVQKQKVGTWIWLSKKTAWMLAHS